MTLRLSGPHPALLHWLWPEKESSYLSPNYSFQAAWAGQMATGRSKQHGKNDGGWDTCTLSLVSSCSNAGCGLGTVENAFSCKPFLYGIVKTWLWSSKVASLNSKISFQFIFSGVIPPSSKYLPICPNNLWLYYFYISGLYLGSVGRNGWIKTQISIGLWG